MINKPFAESSEQNKEPIKNVLSSLFEASEHVLEIGSGTGQHAVYFAEAFPHLIWLSSDRAENLPGIHLWLAEAGLTNTPPAIELDVSRSPWPRQQIDAVYSANTAHIMHWAQVEDCFAGVGRVLGEDGLFALYGPFNYDGKFTSESNARFDQWLKTDDPGKGIRGFEALDQLAQKAGMQLLQDFTMPANNRLLCWKKSHV